MSSALLQAQASDPNSDATVRPQQVQRVNYDVNINGRLNVFGLAGDDYFAVDDNSAITSLDGGAGSDQFQIGQLYGPLINTDGTISFDLNTSPSDDFSDSIIRTTRGFLSRGISAPLVAKGGTGGDTFTVYSNSAELRLEGDAGNDLFVVRAFALADENGKPIVNSDKQKVELSTGKEIFLRSGGGNDEVQYNVNAPVSIDGGSGFDKVVVLGTEFSDDFVITKDGVFGGGTNVSFVNVEVVEVDGLEGDDEFFVISTPFGVATRLIGGLGSDAFNITGDVVEDIVTQELEGESGLINHQVETEGEVYQNVLAPGLDLNVASAAEGVVFIEELNNVGAEDGESIIREGGFLDRYSVRLAQEILGDTVVYVTVSATRSNQDEENINVHEALRTLGSLGDSLLLSTSGSFIDPTPADFFDQVEVNQNIESVPARALVLRFDASNWNQAQFVHLHGVEDSLAEGERVVTVNHSVAVNSAASAEDRAIFNQAAVRNVEVTIQDNDAPGLLITETDSQTLVLEGNATTGITDTYDLTLARAPALGELVTVSLLNQDGQLLFSSADSRFNNGVVTFDEANWDNAVTIVVAADNSDDGTLNGFEVPDNSVITHQISGTVLYTNVADLHLTVQVFDNESADVIIVESGNDTVVLEDGTTDDYTIRLSKQPDAEVSINLLPGGLTNIVSAVDEAGNDRLSIKEIGQLVSAPKFFGNVIVSANNTIQRTDLGSFLDDHFAVGQFIQISGAGSANDNSEEDFYEIAGISGDGKTITVAGSASLINQSADITLSQVKRNGLVTGD
ncbi:MAG: hypothetical protein KAR12_16810, partial [Methylococcales bacterium]|nr:hypothetical protein [Methylococcales bacterium]